jgi:hypothetical protein
MEHTENLWKQYIQHIDTYKFYIDIVVKLIGFYFAVSGAMLSFYFTNTDIPSAKFSLYLPFIMGSGLLMLFSIGAWLSLVTREDVFDLAGQIGFKVAPETGVLTLLLGIFSVVLLTCLIGLGVVLWC